MRPRSSHAADYTDSPPGYNWSRNRSPRTREHGKYGTLDISLSLSSSLSALSGWIEYLCWLAAFEAARARISKGSQRVESDGGGFF